MSRRRGASAGELALDRSQAVAARPERVIDADVTHLHWLRREIGDDLIDAAVIYSGYQAYRRTDGIAVIPAALLGP